MIALAFAQMIYYVAQSLRSCGGSDGFSLATRVTLGGVLDLDNAASFYYPLFKERES